MHVNLKNLHEATEQQIFDQVAQHLLKQGRRCVRLGGGCVYRGPNGMKCAAGALIDDDEFNPRLDSSGLTWLMAVAGGLVPAAHANFVRGLQNLHDQELGQFEPKLREFARAHKLVFNEAWVNNDRA